MKKGFTLAEILLTLAIVGVVASLTIPAIVNHSSNKKFVTGLEKANFTMNAALKRAIVTNGPVREWTETSVTADFEKYFLPYLDLNRNCGTGTGCFSDDYKILRSTGSDCVPGLNADTKYYKVIMADGISLAFSPPVSYNNATGDSGTIYVDVNGLEGPNLCGRDLFRFALYSYTNNIKAYGIYGAYDTVKKNRTLNSSFDCSASSADGCAARIFTEGGMKY